MKLLLLSDEENKYLWDHYEPGRLDEYDLILSCGDLKANYLSFLVTMGRVPLVYVHGNHDTGYEGKPPEGCDCAEDRIVKYNGLKILGLGGCRFYNGGPHQYTERQMASRIRKLYWKIFLAGGVDIVLAHAPAAGYGDADDPAHQGFKCFLKLIDRVKPKYFIHGHMHLSYGHNIQRRMERNGTIIINAYDKYELEI
ncbi:MAG: metallophosphoesterase [Oscillospiraceae bacterium]|nr:metallophosphoesterase [Oscillospiraceae bacterium]